MYKRQLNIPTAQPLVYEFDDAMNPIRHYYLGLSLIHIWQMINILTEQNVRASIASLTDRDILITPDLSEFTAGDFNAFDAIERAGYEAVMKHRAELERFRVDVYKRQVLPF